MLCYFGQLFVFLLLGMPNWGEAKFSDRDKSGTMGGEFCQDPRETLKKIEPVDAGSFDTEREGLSVPPAVTFSRSLSFKPIWCGFLGKNTKLH